MADHLLGYPLTPKTVHLCVDMQRIFSEDGPSTPWMARVLPMIGQIVHCHPERTVFSASSRLSIRARRQACGNATIRVAQRDAGLHQS